MLQFVFHRSLCFPKDIWIIILEFRDPGAGFQVLAGNDLLYLGDINRLIRPGILDRFDKFGFPSGYQSVVGQ